MGNKPDTFIQCGLNQKQPRPQVTSTREQAIRANRGQHIFRQQFKTQKSQTKISNTSQSSTSIRNQLPISKVQLTQTPLFTPVIKVQSGQRTQSKENIMVNLPEHENLTKVSKTPKDGYIKQVGSDYFEEMKGQCLDEIIQSRYNTTMHFPDYQIKGLLQSLVYSLAYMTKKNIPHHDFYPTRIYYNNGNFKLLNPALVKNSAYSTTQQRKRFSFLSPQLILEILNDRNQAQIEKIVMDKADVFAIGMIVLEFCTLEPSSECYDPQTYSIVDSIVQQRIDKASRIYNTLIGDCIDLMLQYQVEKRINPIQLAYAVHSKMRDLKNEEHNNEMSRINQNSRMTMSAKIPQSNPNQPLAQKMIPPNVVPPPYMMGDPKVIQGASQNAFNQPVLISSNPYNMMPPFNAPPSGLPSYTITSPPQYPQNYPPPSFSNQNINAFKQNVPTQSAKNMNFPENMGQPNQNLSQNPQSLKNLSSQIPSQASISAMQSDNSTQKKEFYVTSQNSSFTDVLKKPTQQLPSNYTVNTYPPNSFQSNSLPTTTFSNTPYLAQTPSNPTVTTKKQTNILSPNSKMKLNPFEQIEQDFKQDEDQSPMVDKFSYNKVQKQSETASESKPSAYTFRTTQPSSGNSVSSNSNSTSFVYQNKEQTLDERVRKILQASKNIK